MITTYSTRDVALEAVKKKGLALQFAHEDLQKDKDVVLEAVKKNGLALQFAHEDLQKDKDVVLEAVKKNGSALQFAHEDLQKDKDVVLEAVKTRGSALFYAHEDLQNDKDFVLEAVKNRGSVLQFAHEDLQKDKDVVLEAVKQNGLALFYAHEDLQNDKELVLEAVKQNGRFMPYVRTDSKPFLKALVALVALKDAPQDKLNTDQKKKAVGDIIHQCETLFIANQESTADLTKVLERTKEFLNGESNREQYQEFSHQIAKKPSPGMQLLGKLMMGLAAIVLGISIMMASTGVGLLPAAGVAASSFGLFGGGFALDKKGKNDNSALIESLSKILCK